MDETPRVLGNRGPLIPLLGDDGELHEHELRYTQAAFCAIEEKYETLTAWKDQVTKTPLRMQREAIAICFDIDITDDEAVKAFGKRMVGPPAAYDRAFTEAWAIANGVDPTDAGELSKEIARLSLAAMDQALTEALPATAPTDHKAKGGSSRPTRGRTGAKPGAPSGGTSNGSGT